MLRSTVVFSTMTFLSRIAGFVRDWLQASMFGTSAAVSAFVVAYRIPNYLRRIFAEGSFSSAFVPVLSELKQRGDEAALQDFLDHVAGALLGVVIVVTGLGILLAPWIAQLFLLFADESASKIVPLTAQMLRITFPYLAFISMTALAGSVLNTFRHFGLPALTPVLHNLGVIAGMLLLARFFAVPEKALAWGVVLAGALQLLVLWPAMARWGLRPRLKFNLRHEGVRRVFKLMAPTIFSSSVAQVNLLVGTIFASLLVPSAQSWLYYSDRLTELPLGLFGVAIGTVILPQLSRHHADADTAGYSKSLDWGLRMVLLVGMPAALGLALLAEPLTASLFRYGKFVAYDTRMVGYALTAMSVGIPAFMLSKVLLPAFYARQDTRTPMRVAVTTVVANVLMTVAIVTPLYLSGFEAAHAGIAAATALAGVLNAALLWRRLRQQGLYAPEPGWRRWLLRIFAGLVAMTLAVLAVRSAVGDWSALRGWMRWLWLLVAVGAGALAYGAALLALGLRPRHLRH
ncbi:murein biosynthesis integral membrane protein MurJ [Agrilutibacter solisilvae]|uniref:Probable lipid II flippase MurJ n=1 Tax=Agrilutibacter solisilvae TaxID=2763317 RepID=A0A974XWS6_9GAMM|nr:murein biosynthesis integral membrane protein MurJ [Lysobacter solisilvae]QSX77306.1 murein biosynthesis integral membrane protein MurJ [Lysobacter solisilvae]